MSAKFMHELNPSFKLLTHLIVMTCFIFVKNPFTSILLAIIPLSVMIGLARIPLKTILLRMSPFILFFISSTWMLAAYGKGETVLLEWAWFRFTEEGLSNGLNIGFRMIGFVLYGLLFTMTTDMTNFILSLMQQCRLRPKWAYALLAGFRFVPMFREEFEQIKAAHRIRGVSQLKGIRGKWESLLRYTIPLLAQAIRKAERVAVALEARGFDGSWNRTFYRRIPYGYKDAAYLVLVGLLNAMVFLFVGYVQ
jgi:energy-coupling factor transport system permease protein